MLRARFGSTSMLNDNWRLSASWRNGRPTVSSRLDVRISSASTVTVPDSILERSRMSLIRLSRSVPAPWMVRANSTCLPLRLPSGFSVNCWPRDQDAVERRAQLMRTCWPGTRTCISSQRKLGGLFFERAPRLLDFLVLALHLDVTLGELLSFCSSCSLVCCNPSAGPATRGKLLRLLQQAFGLHRGFDAVQHDADAVGELIEERHLRSGE